MKVCIVDDAQFIRQILKEIFTSLGHHVIAEFSSASQLIEEIEDLKPDIITLDITMPDIDGLTATRIIKNILPNTYIIIISAISQPDIEKEAKRCGAFEFIKKPFSKLAIEHVLSQIKQEQSSKNGAIH
ncbi:response regulator receiver protein [Caldicellulosiruptor kronotskyensis 2002]|uniref:Response regulator receiver protein n=1 Tax=Caldicellulosiruptor kronotskyensis (strain DSM 18902 / VKM B-2412 / 2002) TaxID=632348 RepID=E4SHJ6_CALK2|nr:response regulator [Caldicellulosiruptor kronotskyensis]ADQ47221.1 response regulator receiver protein [Caldicellulosiruptor kronotskyensis 2002]